jgi:hypothetical protein
MSLDERALVRLIKPLNETAWLHLFRKTKGAEVVRDIGHNLPAVFAVKDALDLEKVETAYHYAEKYSVKKEKTET